jgi:hypothetical protein
MVSEGGTELPDSDDDLVALERALEETPRGAVAVAGAAVALLMVGWFFLYFFVFLPRGSVG